MYFSTSYEILKILATSNHEEIRFLSLWMATHRRFRSYYDCRKRTGKCSYWCKNQQHIKWIVGLCLQRREHAIIQNGSGISAGVNDRHGTFVEVGISCDTFWKLNIFF